MIQVGQGKLPGVEVGCRSWGRASKAWMRASTSRALPSKAFSTALALCPCQAPATVHKVGPDEYRGNEKQTLWVFLCLLMLPVTFYLRFVGASGSDMQGATQSSTYLNHVSPMEKSSMKAELLCMAETWPCTKVDTPPFWPWGS